MSNLSFRRGAILLALVLTLLLYVFFQLYTAPRTETFIPLNKSTAPSSAYASPISPSTSAWLYSPESHKHLSVLSLDESMLAPLTHWAQSTIYAHQHPVQCNDSRFVLGSGNKMGTGSSGPGIGSNLHVATIQLAFAIETGRVFLWASNAGEEWTDASCSVRNFECHFRPPSSCSRESAGVNAETIQNTMVYLSLVPKVFVDAMHAHFPDMSDNAIKFWWRGQAAAYLARLNENALAAIRDMRRDEALLKTFPVENVSADTSRVTLASGRLPPGSIHAHVRHGDKSTEMQLQDTDAYLRAADALVHQHPWTLRRILFISTEDGNVIRDTEKAIMEATLGAPYPGEVTRVFPGRAEQAGWTLVYSNLPRMEGIQGVDPQAFVVSQGNDKRSYSTRTHLWQLLMALEADAWIGTRISNWNRLIEELRCIWVPKCPLPYVEVGQDLPGRNYLVNYE